MINRERNRGYRDIAILSLKVVVVTRCVSCFWQPYINLQLFTGYLGLILVFMRMSARRERFDFGFTRVFASINKIFFLAARLGTSLLFYEVLRLP